MAVYVINASSMLDYWFNDDNCFNKSIVCTKINKNVDIKFSTRFCNINHSSGSLKVKIFESRVI